MPTDRSTERKIVDAYASSMLQAAGDSQERILGIESQLRSLQHAYYLNDALASAFCSNNKHEDDKRKMAQELFKSFDSELQPILITLAVRGDIQYIERIVNAYIDKAENKLGCVIVDVVTAVELDDYLREVIGKKLEGDFGKPAIIRECARTSY